VAAKFRLRPARARGVGRKADGTSGPGSNDTSILKMVSQPANAGERGERNVTTEHARQGPLIARPSPGPRNFASSSVGLGKAERLKERVWRTLFGGQTITRVGDPECICGRVPPRLVRESPASSTRPSR